MMFSNSRGKHRYLRKRKNRVVCILGAAVSTLLTLGLLAPVALGSGAAVVSEKKRAQLRIAEQFDMYMTNAVSDAMGGILAVEKVYWLKDEDIVAPAPDPACYGETDDPARLEAVIGEAAALLEGQELLFRMDLSLEEGRQVKYYLDETIFAITWKETVGRTEYTFSEVKIAHPSQFRRFLSGGEYGSGILYTTTEMAQSVNAVTAASGDYYSYRPFGNTVYNGMVKRAGDSLLDTCYVDTNGDLLFAARGELVTQEEVERYVEENDIRFSLAFGPLMIRDGDVVAGYSYSIGEADGTYSRAALCQQDELHYVMVAANRR